MLKRIIVAFDGSELSHQAFIASLTLARATGATLMAIHIIEPSMEAVLAANPAVALDPLYPPVVLPQGGAAFDEQQREWAREAMKELETRCRDAGVACRHRVEVGGLVEWLVGEAGPDDLIAVGMKGRFRRAGVGSATRSLVMHAPCPVMVVGGPAAEFGRVTAVFDATEHAEDALRFARDLSDRSGWPLSALAAARAGVSAEQASARCQELIPGLDVVALEATDNETEAQLVERIASGDRTALLVMGAYADSWLQDLLFGSTTGEILSRLGAPVILVRHAKA